MSWRRTTETSSGVSFETCLGRLRDVSFRRRHDVPLWHRGDVPVRRLGDVPLRRRWVFHLRLVWEVIGTYQCDVLGTYPWDVVTTFLYDIVETYQWDVLATYHWDVVGCFIWDVLATSLGRIERRRCDVAMTSPCLVGCWFDCLFNYARVSLKLSRQSTSFVKNTNDLSSPIGMCKLEKWLENLPDACACAYKEGTNFSGGTNNSLQHLESCISLEEG